MIRVFLALLVGCSGGGTATPPLPDLPPRVDVATPATLREARPLRQLTLALTGEVRGEIEPCGCPTVPYGGFVRRGSFLDRLRREDVPLFVLDAGEMLLKGSDVEGKEERARAVLDLARATGLDAWAPAPLDLVPGGIPLLGGSGAVSATWTDPGGAPVLPPTTVIERGGVRLGVVGLSGHAADLGNADAVGAVAHAIASGGAADAWVVLSNATPEVTEAVAAGVPGVGLVVSLRGETRDEPRATSGAPIVETAERGKWVTVVRAFLAATPGPWRVVTEGPAVAAANLTRAAVTAGGAGTREANARALAAARQALASELAGQDVAVVEDQPLGSEFDGDGAIRARVDRFEKRAIALATTRVEAAGGPVYGTAAYCTRCHEDFTARWVGQPHARAHEALVAKGQLTNPECVGCHTTGWGQPGGFSEPTSTAMLTWKDVQCEACHGPLLGHPDSGVKPRPITRETCVRCHDSANSPSFEYARYLEGVSCVQLLADRKSGMVQPPP
jgi:hypothetical protein